MPAVGQRQLLAPGDDGQRARRHAEVDQADAAARRGERDPPPVARGRERAHRLAEGHGARLRAVGQQRAMQRVGRVHVRDPAAVARERDRAALLQRGAERVALGRGVVRGGVRRGAGDDQGQERPDATKGHG
jgi:hypothetical protein